MLLKTTLLLGAVLVAADDSCVHANDGQCDDTSWGATGTRLCDDGTDDTDCNKPGTCENTCTKSGTGRADVVYAGTNFYFNDGSCDDTTWCDYGTDCADCGPADPNRCDDSCGGGAFANDGQCDECPLVEGFEALCDVGTDCTDCSRSASDELSDPDDDDSVSTVAETIEEGQRAATTTIVVVVVLLLLLVVCIVVAM